MPYAPPVEQVARNVVLWTDAEDAEMRTRPGWDIQLMSLSALAEADEVTAGYLVALHDRVPGYTARSEVGAGGLISVFGRFLGADEERTQLRDRAAWAAELVAKRP